MSSSNRTGSVRVLHIAREQQRRFNSVNILHDSLISLQRLQKDMQSQKVVQKRHTI